MLHVKDPGCLHFFVLFCFFPFFPGTSFINTEAPKVGILIYTHSKNSTSADVSVLLDSRFLFVWQINTSKSLKYHVFSWVSIRRVHCSDRMLSKNAKNLT